MARSVLAQGPQRRVNVALSARLLRRLGRFVDAGGGLVGRDDVIEYAVSRYLAKREPELREERAAGRRSRRGGR